jgi:PST family polysaccharide transporter
MAGLGVVSEPFVQVMLGDEWLPVIPVFRILALVGLVQSVQSTVGHIFISKGRTDLMFYVGLAHAVLCVTGFLIGVQWGIVGVAWAYAVVYLGISMSLSQLTAIRLIGLTGTAYVRAMAPQVAITAAMTLACLLWIVAVGKIASLPAVALLATTVAVGVLVYCGLMLRTRPAVMGHLHSMVTQNPDSRFGRIGLSLTRWLAARA